TNERLARMARRLPREPARAPRVRGGRFQGGGCRARQLLLRRRASRRAGDGGAASEVGGAAVTPALVDAARPAATGTMGFPVAGARVHVAKPCRPNCEQAGCSRRISSAPPFARKRPDWASGDLASPPC